MAKSYLTLAEVERWGLLRASEGGNLKHWEIIDNADSKSDSRLEITAPHEITGANSELLRTLKYCLAKYEEGEAIEHQFSSFALKVYKNGYLVIRSGALKMTIPVKTSALGVAWVKDMIRELEARISRLTHNAVVAPMEYETMAQIQKASDRRVRIVLSPASINQFHERQAYRVMPSIHSGDATLPQELRVQCLQIDSFMVTFEARPE